MSILKEIQNACASQRLYRLRPLFQMAPIDGRLRKPRTLYVSPEIKAIAEPEAWDADELGDTHAQMRSQLDKFSGGLTISVSQKPFSKKPSTDLARVHPPSDECWDIRCFGPAPGLRVFGRFAERDTFVALHYDYRDGLDVDPEEWTAAVQTTLQNWRDLFSHPPLRKSKVDDYLEANFEISET